MKNEEVMIFANRFYDLKCAYYGVLFREKNTKTCFERYEGWNASAEVIRDIMTRAIFHSVATEAQARMSHMFCDIEQRAMESEKASSQKSHTDHYVGELDDIFENYGFLE